VVGKYGRIPILTGWQQRDCRAVSEEMPVRTWLEKGTKGPDISVVARKKGGGKGRKASVDGAFATRSDNQEGKKMFNYKAYTYGREKDLQGSGGPLREKKKKVVT